MADFSDLCTLFATGVKKMLNIPTDVVLDASSALVVDFNFPSKSVVTNLHLLCSENVGTIATADTTTASIYNGGVDGVDSTGGSAFSITLDKDTISGLTVGDVISGTADTLEFETTDDLLLELDTVIASATAGTFKPIVEYRDA